MGSLRAAEASARSWPRSTSSFGGQGQLHRRLHSLDCARAHRHLMTTPSRGASAGWVPTVQVDTRERLKIILGLWDLIVFLVRSVYSSSYLYIIEKYRQRELLYWCWDEVRQLLYTSNSRHFIFRKDNFTTAAMQSPLRTLRRRYWAVIRRCYFYSACLAKISLEDTARGLSLQPVWFRAGKVEKIISQLIARSKLGPFSNVYKLIA